MKNRISNLLDKVPILKYVLSSLVKWFAGTALVLGAVFAVLWFTGVYSQLESILDLKYNSLFVLVPLYSFAALAVLCFVIGILLWIYKYKRPKSRSTFGKVVSRIPVSSKKLLAVMIGVLIVGEAWLPDVAIEAYAAEEKEVPEQMVPISSDEEADYRQNMPNGNNGWYKEGGALEITPAGSFNLIREGKKGKWKRKLTRSQETPVAGTEVIFYLANSKTGETSGPQTVIYRLDNTAPDNVCAELKTVYVTESWDTAGMFTQKEWEREYRGDVNGDGERNTDNYWYHVILTAEDELSGVSYFLWKYKNSDSWSEPVSADNGTAQINVNYNQWYAGRGIYVKACDIAGNMSKEVSVSSDNFLTVEYDMVHFQRYVNNKGEDIFAADLDGSTCLIYNGVVTVKMTATADVFEDTEITVEVNNTNAADDVKKDVKWSQDGSNYVGTFTLSEGDSIVKITAEKYSILSNETGSKVVVGEYISNTHIVDMTDPVIAVSFDETADEMENIFTSDRSMTVSVRDKNFRPDGFSVSEIPAKDLYDSGVSNFRAEDLLNTLKSALWETEGDMHRATIILSTEAIYDFTLGYSDLANNDAEFPCKVEQFTIDKNAPTKLRITYNSDPVSMLLNADSFGYYNPSVTVRIYAEDLITGVDHFNWTYTREEGASTVMNKDMVSEQIDCTDSGRFFYEDGGRTAVAEFTLTADEFVQYRGGLFFTATDKAGHTSSVHYGDGRARDEYGKLQDTGPDYVVVVDTIAPLCEVTYLEPQQTREEDAGLTVYYDGTYGDIIPVTLKITEANFYFIRT